MNPHRYSLLIGINAPYDLSEPMTDLINTWVEGFAKAAGKAHLIPSGTIVCQVAVHDDTSMSILLDLPQSPINADPMDAIDASIMIHFTGQRITESLTRFKACAHADQGENRS